MFYLELFAALDPDNLGALIDTAMELKLTPVLPVPLESLSNVEHLQRIKSE